MEEKEYKLTQEQFDNLLKLSNIEIAVDTQENIEEIISRAIIGIERRLNYFNTPLSFFTAEVTNVLIVDDTELSIFQLSVMLEKIGMNVYVARNKEEAYAEFKKKNLFGVWQPDNFVVTLRLDRVEKPIPLFVKRVELTNFRKGIGGFDGTNSVVRFDLMKGDWLAPYGKGEMADLEFKTVLEIKGKERKFRYASRKVEDVLFYELATDISPCSTNDAISKVQTKEDAGIKIRMANDDFSSRRIVRSLGKRKIIRPKFPNEWNCEYYSNYNKSQCYKFRVRSRYDEKGNLKEAYYGKIYGDFEIQGDEKRGITSISFLYYFNPTSLDRNLEWDMKTNLCPEPGVINPPREP